MLIPCAWHSVEGQWQACSESAAVSVARSRVSAVSSEADTTQSSCWIPLPKVVEPMMPPIAHIWVGGKSGEAGVLGGASEGA